MDSDRLAKIVAAAVQCAMDDEDKPPVAMMILIADDKATGVAAGASTGDIPTANRLLSLLLANAEGVIQHFKDEVEGRRATPQDGDHQLAPAGRAGHRRTTTLH